MVFTEQQLQVKKLVDVQQDIEIDALNDGVNRVNSNVVKNTQDISAQSDRISEAEARIGNLETADTQIYNTIEQVQTATAQAITDAVSAAMTSIGNQVATSKVTATEGTIGSLQAGSIKLPLINSEIPVESNKVLGYDIQGNIIPVEATFELGVPSNAAYLKTDENANVEAGVPDSTVTEDSTNLVTSGAVYTAIDNAADTLDSKIDFTAGGLSTRIDRIEDTQSMVIQNEPYQNKAVNKPGMRTIMYDPSDDETYWSDVNLVPPMNENTIGKFLTNNNNVPQWEDIPNELPEYTTSDDGKSLKVKYNNGAAELEWEKDVPDYASSDVGKVLTVKDNNGSTELGWESEKELPNFTTSQANKVLTVKNNNGTAEVAWENTQSTLPSTTGNAGKVLAVNSTGDGVEWQIKNPDTLSASDHSASKSYLVKGAGSDGDVAHYLRGDGTWGEVPNTIPDFGSTDAGKVLAINSNGTDPEWVANEPILPTASSSTLGGVKSATTGTTPYRDYNVQVNANGTMKVNVPWTDTLYSLPTANGSTLGGVKSATTGTTANRDYNVEVNSNGTMKVNVPWTDTLPPILASTQYSSSQGYRVRGPGEDKATTEYFLAGDGTWQSRPISNVIVGDSDATVNETSTTATGNSNTYIGVVQNGTRTSGVQVVGEGGITVSSNKNGELVIESPTVPSYNILKTDSFNNNNISSVGYLVFGPGSSKANTNYYLAGDGNWVKVVGSGATTVSSNSNGELVISSPIPSTYNTLSPSNSSVSGNYTIKGPGVQNATADYVLAGNGNWVKVVGSGGTTVSSNNNGELVIDSSIYYTLSAANSSASGNYTIKGPGVLNATTNYVLAGNGSWVKGVPQPTSSDYGKTLKCDSSGKLYWG
jgi:hypothetical protein